MTFRIGHGYDLHRLRPTGTLWLAGVAVSDEMSAVAHSDGDVVIHATVDALLGALGLGDIGEHFPDTDPKWKGAPSRLFLEHAVSLVHQAGYAIANVDVTILAERPRLKPFKPEMTRRLSEILSTAHPASPIPVNIKAGTNEGCDAIGQGQAIAAHAMAMLMKIPET